MHLEDLTPAQQSELDRVVAAENVDRARRGLAALTPQQYLDAGFQHSFLASPIGVPGAASPRSAAASIDHTTIYARLNRPQQAAAGAETREAPAIETHDGEAFARSIFARANARPAKPAQDGDGE